MYIQKSFTLYRKASYYKSFQDFMWAAQYYLKAYKNKPNIVVTVNKLGITFTDTSAHGGWL